MKKKYLKLLEKGIRTLSDQSLKDNMGMCNSLTECQKIIYSIYVKFTKESVDLVEIRSAILQLEAWLKIFLLQRSSMNQQIISYYKKLTDLKFYCDILEKLEVNKKPH